MLLLVYQNRFSDIRFVLLVVLLALLPIGMFAQDEHQFYFMEVGVQGGASYYVGELVPHVLMSVGETYGAQLRYKIDPRWAVQLKGQRQRVMNTLEEGNEWGVTSGDYKNTMWHVDVVGEYNFFQLGLDEYNIHMRSLTPYMFLGAGATIYEDSVATNERFAVYLPIGIGLKWKFAERWQLQLAWQHNLYVWNGDGLEGIDEFNNKHEMNGSNIMNNDVTSTLTAGVVFEFGRSKKVCLLCDDIDVYGL